MAEARRRGVLEAARRGAADALLPQRCIECGEFGAALHEACLDALPRAEPPRCARCWAPPPRGGRCPRCASAAPAFEALRTPYRFAGRARRALIEAKFRGVSALLEPLGRAAARAAPASWTFGAVAPVPLHPSRRRRRGFDQAALLARAAAAELGAPLRAGLLRRARATPAQSALGAGGRARNLLGAFEAAEAPPREVLLVDDVATTGATLEAAARALRAAGAERVLALTVARED